jgi:hypothetical protein
MRIYVAGGSTESARCRAFMNRLREMGHVITLDWVAFMEESGAADADLPEERCREGALADWEGVKTASTVVFLAPAAASRGMQTELGLALAARKTTIAVGDLSKPVVARGCGLFGTLVSSWVQSDEDALSLIGRSL